MAFINQLERKAGWLAIPGVVKVVMSFQALVWVLLVIQGAKSGNGELGIPEMLYLDLNKVMAGEVWRLVSFIFLPPTFGMRGLIFMVFAFYFTTFLGSILEGMWGAFRTTLYVIGFILGCWLAAVVLMPFAPSYGGNFGTYLVSWPGNSLFFSALIFAAAVYHPQLEVNLFGLIPVKLMWLAIFDAGILVIEILKYLPGGWPISVAILCSMSVFFVVFGPGFRKAMKMRGETAARRGRFEAAKLPANEAMHECATCGKTEHDDADLDFRVSADGEEYCDRCREAS